ncbi:MAG: hypothetical protein ACFFDW_02205 [Candidatus Thorarchaeota archaeon]
MLWKIKHIFNFDEKKSWKNGYAQFGFHDHHGNNYVLRNEDHWLGQITRKDNFLWTAGSSDPKLSDVHIKCDIKSPMYLSRANHEEVLFVSSGGNKQIFKIYPKEETAEVFIDAKNFGLTDIGNCVCDKDDALWINEITGCRIWQFNSQGEKIVVLGNGQPGFQKEKTKFERVQFNWIYDIRLGSSNDLYVLDSRNFAVRKVDVVNGLVETIAGTGRSGYTGDGDIASQATFGAKVGEQFDGPWSLSLDEEENIFIGDTQNHVIRMIEKKTEIISTIAGNKDCIPHKRNSPLETSPLKLNLPRICSLDYYQKELFIPEWDGDLIVLEKQDS